MTGKISNEKACEMIKALFAEKLKAKEDEVELISQRIKEVQSALQLVRYGSVTNLSNQTQIYGPQSEHFLPSIHPAASVLLQGKRPRTGQKQSKDQEGPPIKIKVEQDPLTSSSIVPVFVPPKPKPGQPVISEPRGSHLKAKRRIIVGNVSKWIPPDDREDMSTHKWMLYVRGDKENPDVSDVVEKVRFLIHQSYHPNDQVEVTKAPFQLTRRGWGEFTARILIFFKNSQLNKNLNILHDLKLDKTYTGLQTLGAETVADVWLYQDPEKENKNSL